MTSRNKATLGYLLIPITYVLLVLASCHKTVVPATPIAAEALTADGIVIRLNEFQAALISYCGPAASCAPGTLNTATFRTVLGDLIIARSALKQVPNGWQATVKTAWASVKVQLANWNATQNPLLASAFMAVDALIGAL